MPQRAVNEIALVIWACIVSSVRGQLEIKTAHSVSANSSSTGNNGNALNRWSLLVNDLLNQAIVALRLKVNEFLVARLFPRIAG